MTTEASRTTAVEAAPGGVGCEDAEEDILGVTATEAGREEEGAAGGATTATLVEGAAAGAAHTKKIMLRVFEQQSVSVASFLFCLLLFVPFLRLSVMMPL